MMDVTSGEAKGKAASAPGQRIEKVSGSPPGVELPRIRLDFSGEDGETLHQRAAQREGRFERLERL